MSPHEHPKVQQLSDRELIEWCKAKENRLPIPHVTLLAQINQMCWNLDPFKRPDAETLSFYFQEKKI